MNITATVLLAFGMSMDAFAASIGKGATLHKPKFSEALRTGLIFGAVETLTPLIGWGMGMLASRFVLEWNHWIAFVLLIFLGGRMIIEGFRGADDEDEEPRRRHGFSDQAFNLFRRLGAAACECPYFAGDNGKSTALRE